MPLTPGADVSTTIRELHGGNTYKHTSQKFGKERANAQAVAIALKNKREGHADGGIANRDIGGAVDPVQQVMNALSAGSNQGGVGGGPQLMGAINSAAPSSAQATANLNNTISGIAAPTPPTMTSNATPSLPTPSTLPNPINRATGGVGFNVPPKPVNNQPSWQVRQEARALHTGPILSSVPGRTDNHQAKVPSGSYVIPAATISSLGHGNSNAGLSIASRMFSGPYGMGAPKIAHGPGAPPPPKPMGGFGARTMTKPMFSEGGSRGSGDHVPVDVNLSGGEFVIEPREIIRRWGSLKNGHAVLDAFVLANRKKEIQTLRTLPGPAKK